MLLTPKQQELLRDTPRFLALIGEGKSAHEIAAVFGTDVRPVRGVARLLGYELREAFVPSAKYQARAEAVRLDPEQTAARDARIVSWREAGRSLEEIGQELGITRERVRQILKLLGRDDLRNVGCATRPDRMITWACRGCGKEHTTAASLGKRGYCDRECFLAKRRRESTWAQRVPEIIAARKTGKTWREIGETYGVGLLTPVMALRRYATEEEMRDVMGHDMNTRKYPRALRKANGVESAA